MAINCVYCNKPLSAEDIITLRNKMERLPYATGNKIEDLLTADSPSMQFCAECVQSVLRVYCPDFSL
jgi:hypothetical protein